MCVRAREDTSYATGLTTNLAAAFWKLCAEDDRDDDDCSGALASVGCLRAIATILESVSSLPHLYVQLEPALMPIMRKMLTQEGYDVYEEVLEICSYMTYFSPAVREEGEEEEEKSPVNNLCVHCRLHSLPLSLSLSLSPHGVGSLTFVLFCLLYTSPSPRDA